MPIIEPNVGMMAHTLSTQPGVDRLLMLHIRIEVSYYRLRLIAIRCRRLLCGTLVPAMNLAAGVFELMTGSLCN